MTGARYWLSPEHGLVDLWEHPELTPEPRAAQDLSKIRWWHDAPWSDAFYDAEDDAVYTMRMLVSEGALVVESINLSPLAFAGVAFDAYPQLHEIIAAAQEAVGEDHPVNTLPSGWSLIF